MKIFLLIIFTSLYISLFAQNDSIFISYPSTNGLNTINGFLTESSDNGLAFLSYQFSNSESYFSLIETDQMGNEDRRMDSIFLYGNVNLNRIRDFRYTSDGYLAFANIEKEGKNNLFVSVFIDKNLSTVTALDTIILRENESFLSTPFKKNQKGELETVGLIEDPDDISTRKITYLSATENGQFITQKDLNINRKSFVLDFLRLQNSEELFVSIWSGNSYLFDKNLIRKDSINNSFNSTINGQRFFAGYDFDQAVQIGDKIYCSGDCIAENEYNLSLVEISLNPLKIDTVYPSLPDTVSWDEVVISQMEKDNNGELVQVGTGVFPLSFSGNFVNNLFISKISPTGEKKWSFRIRDTKMLVSRDILIDKNNDIIIVGEYRDLGFENGVRKNFLMKIYSDGTLASTTGPTLEPIHFKVFPNPTSDFLNFEIEDFKNTSGQVFSSTGTLLKTVNIDSNQGKVNVEDLSKGIYFLVLKNDSGAVFQYSKFQKI